MEAIIHTRALGLFGSVSRLDESSVEKSVARRQLSIKAYGENSWFIDIRKLCEIQFTGPLHSSGLPSF